jgi:hypothetical protein
MFYTFAILAGAVPPVLIAYLNWRDARRLRAERVRQ